MNEETLFHAAQLKPAGERVAFLDQACGSDSELRRRVDNLLHAHENPGSFLERPAVDQARTIDSPRGKRDGVEGLDLGPAPSIDASKDPAPITDGPGSHIGPYKLLQQIGEGGMGVVFMAEQARPVRRTVALKIIKPGMDSRQVIARFEAERQALAMMDHPNVAKVFDAGTTAMGLPFFVMELVKGVPITQYCDEQRLTPCQRLELFLPVCQAVQHAHQKGVIHRDLKPSNVLVALYDDKPVPKVIDFGVAKAAGATLTERTMFTGFGSVVGTLEYMSPEQARFNQLDVDTRSDIYALGVLLYELLTGSTPLTKQRFEKEALHESLRIIREEEPPRPSTRLATAAALPSIAANRGIDPRMLRGVVRRELDWIVMRCLEKDRDRRYETANGLARDLQRYLKDEPVQAGPPSSSYRLKKFARRNRAPLAAAGVMIALLIAGIAGTTVWMLRARVERDRAGREADKARVVNQFLQDMLSTPDPAQAKGKDVSVRQMLEEAAKRIDRGELRAQPEIEAAVRTTLGRTYLALGLPSDAEAHLWAALETRRRVLGPEHAEVAASLGYLAEAMWSEAAMPLREQYCRESLAMNRRLLGDESLAVAKDLRRLGVVLWMKGDYAAAAPFLRDALAMTRRLLPPQHREIATALTDLARLLNSRGDSGGAEPLMREALAVRRNLFGDVHPDVARSLDQLGPLLSARGDHAAAEALCQEAVATWRKLLGDEHPELAFSLYNLGMVLRAAGDNARAELLLRESLAMRRKLFGDGAARVAYSLEGLAGVLQNSGKFSEAEALLQEQVTTLRARVGDRDSSLAYTLEILARTLQCSGHSANAEPPAREALAIRRRTLPPDHADVSHSIGTLTPILLDLGKYEEAATLSRECLAIRQKQFHGTWWGLADTRSVLGGALLGLGRPTDAEPLLVDSYQAMTSQPDAEPYRRQEALRRLVKLHETTGRPEKASQWKAELKLAPR